MAYTSFTPTLCQTAIEIREIELNQKGIYTLIVNLK